MRRASHICEESASIAVDFIEPIAGRANLVDLSIYCLQFHVLITRSERPNDFFSRRNWKERAEIGLEDSEGESWMRWSPAVGIHSTHRSENRP